MLGHWECKCWGGVSVSGSVRISEGGSRSRWDRELELVYEWE